MEIKQKQCFGPQLIKHFKLEMIAEQVNETWEFVTLYSRTRGCNRFKALIRTLDLLMERVDIPNKAQLIPRLPAVRKWVERNKTLCNETLERELQKSGISEFAHVLAWSREIDVTFLRQAGQVTVFPMVVECFQIMSMCADITVISQTPEKIVRCEWNEKGLTQYTRAITGQEAGTKTEGLKKAVSGKYQTDRCLMIGDAWGDFTAAREADVLFYPIIPGKEILSWRRFHDEAFTLFITGRYAGHYEKKLIHEFDAVLSETPAWIVHAS
jgi:phosphoglycolate phosphatase-like HAD superfamily hydrolase